MVISPLRTSTRYVIWQLAIQSKGGIKSPRYEKMCRLLFSDYKTKNQKLGWKPKSVSLPLLPAADSGKEYSEWASVMVSFHLLSRLWHVSNYQKAPRAINGSFIESSIETWGNSHDSIPRPRLIQSHSPGPSTNPESLNNLEGPPSGTKNPLRGLPLSHWLPLCDRNSAIHGFSYAVKLSTSSKRYNAPTSMRVVMNSGRYLYMTIPTIKRHDLDG